MEEATDSSDSPNPHASLQAEEEDAEREEQVPQVNQDSGAIAAESEQVPPSSAAASTFTRTKKKKKYRTLSLSEFHHYNEPSSRPSDAPPPSPPHCSSGCESLKFKDGDSLFSRWPPWGPFMESDNEEMRSDGCNSSATAIRPFMESDNEEMRSDECNSATATRPIGYERSDRGGLAESQASKDPDSDWSIWGNTELEYYSPILYPPGMPPSVIIKLDRPVSVENPLGPNPNDGEDDPSPSILGGGESSWPSLPGTNANVVTPVIVQESAWKKGTGVVGNGGQSNSESKENAQKEEEAKTEETNDRN